MTYFTHHVGPVRDRFSSDVTHDWHAYTEARLRWLYGPAHATERAAATQADLAAWRAIGGGA